MRSQNAVTKPVTKNSHKRKVTKGSHKNQSQKAVTKDSHKNQTTCDAQMPVTKICDYSGLWRAFARHKHLWPRALPVTKGGICSSVEKLYFVTSTISSRYGFIKYEHGTLERFEEYQITKYESLAKVNDKRYFDRIKRENALRSFY
jgi:hypothetical protein